MFFFKDDDLIYLDPHYVQSSLPEGQNPINKTVGILFIQLLFREKWNY